MTTRIRFLLPWHILPSTLCILLAGCAGDSLVRQHPEFTLRSTQLKAVTIISPMVEAYVVTDSKQELKEQEKQITDDFTVLVQQELMKRGFETRPMGFNDQSITDSDRLFRDAEIRRLYERLAEELYGKGAVPTKQALSYAVNIGEATKNLALSY